MFRSIRQNECSTGLPVIKAAFPFNGSPKKQEMEFPCTFPLQSAPPGCVPVCSFISTEPRGPTRSVQISCAPATQRQDSSEAPLRVLLLLEQNRIFNRREFFHYLLMDKSRSRLLPSGPGRRRPWPGPMSFHPTERTEPGPERGRGAA